MEPLRWVTCSFGSEIRRPASRLAAAVVLGCLGCCPSVPPSSQSAGKVPSKVAAARPSSESAAGLPASPSGIPIYVTPFYDADGPSVAVGKHSEELARASADSMPALASQMRAEWRTLSVETMYVTSIRLYDLGLKDEAVYWFYSAQFRGRLFASLLAEESNRGMGSEGFERVQAHAAFQELAGGYINGYAFGDLPKLQETIRLVLDGDVMPPPFKTIYPDLQFIAEEEWPEKARQIAAGLESLSKYIARNADEITATRKRNGIEGKY